MMGGELAVQSSPGVGSVFSFTVRLTKFAGRAQGAAIHSRPVAADGSTAALGGVHVLLVEDNALNMELAKAMLRGLGCSIVAAVDGVEAVQAYQAEPFDLVLMDLQMPRMDGFAATAAIRSHQASAAYQAAGGIRTPILALTAHALAGDRARSLASGFDEHLTKPITFAVLKQAVATWARTSSARRPAARASEERAPPETRVIDAAAIDRLREVENTGNDGLVHRVLSQFLSVGEALVSQMTAAVETGDCAGIKQTAHTLKSNSAYLGAERLRACCVAVEAALAKSPPDPVTDLVAEIRVEYDRASDALMKILGEPAAT